MSYTDGTPLSRYFNLPLLLDDATPFSNWFSFSTLKSGYTFGEPNLIDAPDILSRKLGAPVYWDKSVSEELNVPELSADKESKN